MQNNQNQGFSSTPTGKGGMDELLQNLSRQQQQPSQTSLQHHNFNPEGIAGFSS
jgi:hypothetical protein